MTDKMTEEKAKEIIKIHFEDRCCCDPVISCESEFAEGYLEALKKVNPVVERLKIWWNDYDANAAIGVTESQETKKIIEEWEKNK